MSDKPSIFSEQTLNPLPLGYDIVTRQVGTRTILWVIKSRETQQLLRQSFATREAAIEALREGIPALTESEWWTEAKDYDPR